jgi:hypothetical protein
MTERDKVRHILRVVAWVIVFPDVVMIVIVVVVVLGIVIGIPALVYNTIFPPPPPWWCSIQGSEKIPACLR